MEQMKQLKNKADCSACGACLTACPRQAIVMAEDEYGCLYPAIQLEKCIQCGICERICPYGRDEQAQPPLKAYAAVGRCDALVQNSASGGVFATLAMACLQKGGMVAGAVMDCTEQQVRVYHVLSNRPEDVERMQGSKYVQSEAWRCYDDVCAALKAGRTVLFSGTPCQVAAMKRLSGNPDHLITIDLICHGTPPLRMLDDYAKILQKRFHGKLNALVFRDKTCLKNFCARIDIKRGQKKNRYFAKSNFFSFYQYFLDGAIYRENCYSCPYALLQRTSDITLGDYWGIENVHRADLTAGLIQNRNDWSCVLVHTSKGQRMIDQGREKLELYPSKAEWIAKENHQLREPSLRPACRDEVLKAYSRGGYRAVENHFIRTSGGTARYYWRLIKEVCANQRRKKEPKK